MLDRFIEVRDEIAYARLTYAITRAYLSNPKYSLRLLAILTRNLQHNVFVIGASEHDIGIATLEIQLLRVN